MTAGILSILFFFSGQPHGRIHWWYMVVPDATTIGLLGWRRQGDGSSAGRVGQTRMDAAALQPAHAAVAVHAEPGAAGRIGNC